MEHERILQIADYLMRCAADPPGVTIRMIQDYLAANTNLGDVSALTIRRDLDRIEATGQYQLERTPGAHNTAYYRLLSRGFTFNEIRFIVDSVSINRFISDREMKALIKKFEGLCSDKNVRQLISRVQLSHRTPASDLLKNLEEIHRIISEKRMINFEYGKYDVHGVIQFEWKERSIVPVEVLYYNERFYLICFDTETERRRVYRIDRMRRVTSGNICRGKHTLPRPECALVDVFDIRESVRLKLRVKRKLLDEMLETLGKYADSQDDPDHPECVIIRATVGISSNFNSWVLRYGDNIEILAPQHIREDFIQTLNRLREMYSAAETT